MQYGFSGFFNRPTLALVASVCLLVPAGVQAQAGSAANLPAPQRTTEEVNSASGAVAKPVGSAQRQRASQHFRRGAALFQEGAFEGAMVEFQRAYEASPNPGVLFNLAQTGVMLHDYAQAKALFERYLAQGADTIPAERRTLVEAELAQLRNRLGYAHLVVSPGRAEVWVDKRLVGRAPLKDAITLNVGRHLIEVRAEGYRPEAHTIEIAGGEEQKIDFRLRPQANVAEGATTPKRPWLKPAWIGSLGVLGLAGGGAITTGFLASRSHGDLQDELSARPGDPGAINDARERTRRLSRTSDALLGASVVTAAVSVVLLWLDMNPERPMKVFVGAEHVVVRGQF